jgi:hypothetical protein
MHAKGDQTMLNPLILALSAAATAGPTQSPPPPFACRANALDKTQRQRQQALLETVHRTVLAKRELPDGLALTFRGDSAAFVQLAEWISLERRCCPFLAFRLEWKQDDSVSVHLTGEAGVKEFIAAEMGITLEQ